MVMSPNFMSVSCSWIAVPILIAFLTFTRSSAITPVETQWVSQWVAICCCEGVVTFKKCLKCLQVFQVFLGTAWIYLPMLFRLSSSECVREISDGIGTLSSQQPFGFRRCFVSNVIKTSLCFFNSHDALEQQWKPFWI
jgi:hypothetical protein